MIHVLIDFTRGFIEQYGYSGLFFLTSLEHFIFPIPVDMMIAFATSMGLTFSTVIWVVFAGVIIGSLIGYGIGRFLGHPVAVWLFGQKRLDQAERFIKKWGFWGVVIAGLTPIPFKIITITAGIFEMPMLRFMTGVIVGRMPRYLIVGYAGFLFYETHFYASAEMSAVILGALQGITEFLPVSSSGHLAILEHFLKLPPSITAENLELFDILLHGGSLLAIALYFWRDWLTVFQEIWAMLKARAFRPNALAVKLALATLPAVIAGLLFAGAIGEGFRQLSSIALFMIALAMFYLYVEWKHKHTEPGDHVSLKKAVLIGLAQAVALIPGVSRAGVTISMGRLIGLRREAAARFSFMLGGVAIFAANVYTLFSLKNGAVLPDSAFTAFGVVTAFIFSLASIHWLLKFLRAHTMRPFAIYLLLLGSTLLAFF